jgi:integrase
VVWHQHTTALEAERIARQKTEAAELARVADEVEKTKTRRAKQREAQLWAISVLEAEARCGAALDDQRLMDRALAGSYSIEAAAMYKTIRAIDSTVTRYPRSEQELRQMPCGDGRQLIQMSDHGGTRNLPAGRSRRALDMSRYQRGCVRIEDRSDGPSWVYRWYRDLPNGKRGEATKTIGTLATIGKSKAAAWHAVERMHLTEMANGPKQSTAPTVGELAASYLKTELDRLAPTTAYTVRHNLERYILPRWSKSVAVDVKPLVIEDWFGHLRKEGLAAPTVAKIRALMVQVYRHGQRVGLISRAEEANPLNFARASAKTEYRPIAFTPEQAAQIIAQLEQPERTLAFLSAATGLRISESLGLKWSDVDFTGQQIFVRRTWIQGKVGKPKTEASAAPVPMSSLLADAMSAWRAETIYASDSDWVFASARSHGKRPREGGIMAADYLRPAAIKAGVVGADFKGRLGWHSFRHGVAGAMVRSGTDVKTVQRLLRHTKVQTTLDLYCQSVPAEALRAQEEYLSAARLGG